MIYFSYYYDLSTIVRPKPKLPKKPSEITEMTIKDFEENLVNETVDEKTIMFDDSSIDDDTASL